MHRQFSNLSPSENAATKEFFAKLAKEEAETTSSGPVPPVFSPATSARASPAAHGSPVNIVVTDTKPKTFAVSEYFAYQATGSALHFASRAIDTERDYARLLTRVTDTETELVRLQCANNNLVSQIASHAIALDRVRQHLKDHCECPCCNAWVLRAKADLNFW